MSPTTLEQLWDVVWERKIAFFAVFFLVFTATYGVLYAVDFLPEPPATAVVTPAASSTSPDANAVESVATTSDSPHAAMAPAAAEPIVTPAVADGGVTGAGTRSETSDTLAAYEAPRSLHIPKLGRRVTVLNPTSRAIADLDAALLEGVVRHPDAARLGQNGNVFILGHSSYLPVVMNRNFQAFNGIQTLAWGDIIEVTGDSYVHVYRVESVYEAAAQEVTVPIAGAEPRLTLATCDSFGSVDDRFIVEAVFVEKRPV